MPNGIEQIDYAVEYQYLAEDLRQSHMACWALFEKYDALQKQYDHMKEDALVLGDRITELESEVEQKKADLNELELSYQQLQEEHEQLKAESEKKTYELERAGLSQLETPEPTEMYPSFQSDNVDEVTKHYVDLELKNKELQKTIAEMGKEMKKLKHKEAARNAQEQDESKNGVKESKPPGFPA